MEPPRRRRRNHWHDWNRNPGAAGECPAGASFNCVPGPKPCIVDRGVARRALPIVSTGEDVTMSAIILRGTVAAALALALGTAANAQRPVNERNVLPGANVQDKGDINTLHFDFKDPRMMEVDIPGQGKRVVWYMTYWVSNFGKEPFTFYPKFTLLTNRNTLHEDQIMPEVQEQIRKREDPSNRYNFQNSVTISKTAVPLSKPDALPRRVAGIAIWPDVHEKAPNTASFRIFVGGLSNGWSIDDDGKISRKTLLLEFDRRGDGSKIDSSEIQYRDVAKWIYRDSSSADVDLKRPASVGPMDK